MPLNTQRWIATLVAFAALVVLGPSRAQPPGASDAGAHLIRLADGRHINLNCSGSGAPTVLLEGGFAATSRAWVKVQPAVARKTRVCAYDRAGYGLSDEGPLPRDGAAIARDLDETLRRARISGPFVVVGHSAGGLYMRLFSDLRPRDVVGMVLVDPSVEHQDQRLATIFGPGAGSLAPQRARATRCLAAAERHALPSSDPSLKACTPAPRPGDAGDADLNNALQPANWRTQISEADTLWSATSDEVDAGRSSYGDMPLVVLTADDTYANVPPAARKVLDVVWVRLHDEIAARSSRGSSRLISGSSHMMMFDRPDAIETAIDDVIAAGRPKP